MIRLLGLFTTYPHGQGVRLAGLTTSRPHLQTGCQGLQKHMVGFEGAKIYPGGAGWCPAHGGTDLCLSPTAAAQSERQRLTRMSGTCAERKCLTGRLPQRVQEQLGPGKSSVLRCVPGVAIPLYIARLFILSSFWGEGSREEGPQKLQHTACECPGSHIKMSFVQSSAAAEGLKELGQELLGLVTVGDPPCRTLRWGWWKLV